MSGHVRWFPDRLDEPLRWRKPRRCFVCPRGDLFHDGITDEQIAAVFGVMAAARGHTFLVLTKRPERMVEWFKWVASVGPPSVRIGQEAIFHGAPRTRIGEVPLWTWPVPNVWLGVSVEDQAMADERIPLLLQCPAAVRWVSAEPLLGPVDLGGYVEWNNLLRAVGGLRRGRYPHAGIEARLDWLVIGGESGPRARPCNVEWIRSLVRRGREAGTAVWVKQLGARPVFTGEESAPVPAIFGDGEMTYTSPAGKTIPFPLRHPKGADPKEWPEDLRVQEWPR